MNTLQPATRAEKYIMRLSGSSVPAKKIPQKGLPFSRVSSTAVLVILAVGVAVVSLAPLVLLFAREGTPGYPTVQHAPSLLRAEPTLRLVKEQESESSADQIARGSQREPLIQNENLDSPTRKQQNLESLRNPSNHGPCSHGQFSVASPMSLWRNSIATILEASILPLDGKQKLFDMTAEALQIMTPLLPYSVQTLPRMQGENARRQLDDLAQKAWLRYDYLTRHQLFGSDEDEHQASHDSTNTTTSTGSRKEKPSPPPPLIIVVMGGSVTQGINCVSGVGSNVSPCAWPARIENILNSLVIGKDKAHALSRQQRRVKPTNIDEDISFVKVYSFSQGGVNTDIATNLWKHDMLPDEIQQADILIHGYSTNDVHVNTIASAASENKTLENAVFDMYQDFVRTIMGDNSDNSGEKGVLDDGEDDVSTRQSSATCLTRKRPLLLWMDDYIGNEQTKILETTTVSKALALLSSYYGFGAMSYANAVRTIVYSDTHEDLFSPHWYNKHDKLVRDIHPGQGMHMCAAWVVLYNLLTMATQYCSLESFPVGEDAYTDGEISGLPPLKKKGQYGGLDGHKASIPFPSHALPPKLSPTLDLANVSQVWQTAELQSESHEKACNSTGQIANATKCIFAWVAGFPVRGEPVEGFLKTKLKPDEVIAKVRTYFHEFLSPSSDWDLIADTYKNKIGWVPTKGRGSQLDLVFPNLTQPIRVIHVGMLKSYGSKWSGSTARLSATVTTNGKESVHGSGDLLGFHSKNTSEM